MDTPDSGLKLILSSGNKVHFYWIKRLDFRYLEPVSKLYQNTVLHTIILIMKMEAKEILKQHVTKTAMLTDEQFDYFFSHFESKTYRKGQSVISEGQKVDCEYFVIAGCLKAFFINDEIKMYILQFAMPTWWTSDYCALYNQTSATINIDCITDAEVLCISNSDREKICSELHQVERFFRWRTNRGYIASQKRLLSLMNNDTRARYEELMTLYPQLYNLVPKHLVASYLGVSRETLSRLYNSHK